MIVHKIFHRAELGEPHFRMLMSDLHIGSPNVDPNAIVADLEKAKRAGAKIILNGDIADGITAKDPRFDLNALHQSIGRQKDLATAVVDMAREILWPYRHLIDIIGLGNHEESWLKYGNFDVVRHIIAMLVSDKDCQVAHGSFAGYVQTVFRVEGYRQQATHKLMYLHGAGGDSPVTKGTIDMNRKGRNWTFDAFTVGHRHNVFASVDAVADVNSNGKYFEKRQLCLQTGSYLRNYSQVDDSTALNYSYATSKTTSPKPLGGILLCMRPMFDPETKTLYVAQDFMTDFIPTPGKTKQWQQ